MRRILAGLGINAVGMCLLAGRLAQGSEDIRDVRPPVALPASYAPLLFLLGACVFLYGIFFVRRRMKRSKEPPSARASKTPWEEACEQLDALANSPLYSQGRQEEYYRRLSDIVRRYFEAQFNIRAPEMTTEEFLVSLKDSPVLTDFQKGVLREFLVSCDMVKFARYQPGIDEAHKNTQLARRLIDETRKEDEGGRGKKNGV